MNDKPELTWDRICQQVGKKRFEPTPRTRFGRLLQSSKPRKTRKGKLRMKITHDYAARIDYDLWMDCLKVKELDGGTTVHQLHL